MGLIKPIKSGTVLPTLTNPAGPENIQRGYEVIDGSGNLVTGSHDEPTAADFTKDATATAADILNGKTAYVNGTKVTGNIATKTASNMTVSGATVTVPAGYYASNASKSVATATQATPSISVDSAGKITASATQSAGYVAAGTKSGTKQLTTKGADTITPGTTNKTIASGTYLTGVQTIKGDANLKAENIPQGTTIFGVAGTKEVPTYRAAVVRITTPSSESETVPVVFPFKLSEITRLESRFLGANPYQYRNSSYFNTSDTIYELALHFLNSSTSKNAILYLKTADKNDTNVFTASISIKTLVSLAVGKPMVITLMCEKNGISITESLYYPNMESQY